MVWYEFALTTSFIFFQTGNSTTKYYSKKYFKKDCHAWFQSGAREDGPYEIFIAGKYPKTVVCKMVDDGSEREGGWIMALNKTRTHVDKQNNDFIKFWDDYKNGFEVNSGHYLGNEYLHLLTEYEDQQLWVIYDHVGVSKTEFFQKVKIKSEDEFYEISFDETSFSYPSFGEAVNGNGFTASLSDGSTKGTAPNCPKSHKVGWWYTPNCFYGFYLTEPCSHGADRLDSKFAHMLLSPKKR